jgi:hypothetical protein
VKGRTGRWLARASAPGALDLEIVTEPVVVVTRNGAPPPPSGRVRSREIRPRRVTGKSVRSEPFTVCVSSRAE